jgi:hypothetical protein
MHRFILWLGILLAFLTINGTRLYAIKVPLEPAREDPLPADIEDSADSNLLPPVAPGALRELDPVRRFPLNYDVMPAPEDTEEEAKPRPEMIEIRGA